MLSIEMEGARCLIELLQRSRDGEPIPEETLQKVMDSNSFFVDFYCQWEGVTRDSLSGLVRCFDRPEQVPPGVLANRLAEGFRQALDEISLVRGRLAWANQVDVSAIAERVLAYLPANTPLDSTVHLTVDLANNAFVHQGEMGVSLLSGMADRQTFEEAVSHEMHHLGVHYWSAQDLQRQALLQEHSGRSIAVMHVENLLMEGMANFYLTPGYVFRPSSEEPPFDALQGRLARLQREEEHFFALAGTALDMALAPGAEFEPCLEVAGKVAFDMEEMLLPAGHYLGARMLQTIEQAYPRQRVIRCVQHLPDFLPLYNEAAHRTGGFVFDDQKVSEFARLWG
jgi:hypothetical protein